MPEGGGMIGYISLPLMGIGNIWRPDATSTLSSLSLPLMGIGNARITAGFPAEGDDSLPLMGIGNVRDCLLQLLGRQLVLITPHGDRKPR